MSPKPESINPRQLPEISTTADRVSRNLPKTTFEQRSKIYQDLRSLITPGFLSISTKVSNHAFALRSLAPHDYNLLQHRVAGMKGTWRAWTIATSIWMVDGQILGHDQAALIRAYRFVSSLSASTQNHLYRLAASLALRVQRSLEVLEAYLYETESRDLWKAAGTAAFDTGWGENFGQNHVQRYWSLFNTIEDERESRDWEWQSTKFQVGAHAPKGIKKLNEKDWQAQKTLREKRDATKDRIYYETVGLVPKLSHKERAKAVKPVQKAETFEELQEEMKNWVEGKKDSHDNIIEDIKRQMREMVEERRRLEKERAQEMRKAFEEENQHLMESGSFQVLTGEAAEKAAERIFRKTTPKVYSSNRHNSAYDKYLSPKTQIDSGSLQVDEDGEMLSESLSEDQVQTLLRSIKAEDDDKEHPEVLQNLIENQKPLR